MEHKILVAYFSASGATKYMAESIAQEVNADLFEIQPVVPYTSADLNWMDKQSRSTLEMNDESSRPAISKKVDHMEEYQIIFIGFPIWWYVEPRIIDTFLESYDFTGKTLIPFATSGGSQIKKSEKRMQSLYSNAIWKKGCLLNHTIDVEWLQEVLK